MSSERAIVILISGSGSNMAAIVRAAQTGDWARKHRAKVAAVISNRADAGGLAQARALGVPTEVVSHQDFSAHDDPRGAFDAALALRVQRHCPALVVLAGFMRILSPRFVESFEGRLMNIHPSLLPAFPGLNTHQRALDAGCQVAGATVHMVTADLDSGPILAQAVVPIVLGDTAQTLAERVLQQEHLIYPAAIEAWLSKHVAA
jgi:phosphoribosylglycinamide formyltransferase-1